MATTKKKPHATPAPKKPAPQPPGILEQILASVQSLQERLDRLEQQIEDVNNNIVIYSAS